MILIRDVVKEAIKTGYLSVAAEDKLRELLKTKYDIEDFKAFMCLQKAASLGIIRQESRELRRSQLLTPERQTPQVGKPAHGAGSS